MLTKHMIDARTVDVLTGVRNPCARLLDVDPPCAMRQGKVAAEHPSVSALSGDFRALPPLLFVVGANDMLLSDTILTAKRARVAGVKVRFRGRTVLLLP